MSIYDEVSFSVSPYVSRVNKAIEFYKKNIVNNLDSGLMLCIASGPEGGWPTVEGAELPPLPSLSTSQLTNPIGFKRFKNMRFVTSDDAGIYSVGGVLWKAITGDTIEENCAYAKELNARWIYVEAELEIDELNVGDVYYRQMGLYSDLKIRTDLVADYATKTVFLPSEIIRTGPTYDGILEVYQNIAPMRRPTDYREIFSWVIEF